MVFVKEKQDKVNSKFFVTYIYQVPMLLKLFYYGKFNNKVW